MLIGQLGDHPFPFHCKQVRAITKYHVHLWRIDPDENVEYLNSLDLDLYQKLRK